MEFVGNLGIKAILAIFKKLVFTQVGEILDSWDITEQQKLVFGQRNIDVHSPETLDIIKEKRQELEREQSHLKIVSEDAEEKCLEMYRTIGNNLEDKVKWLESEIKKLYIRDALMQIDLKLQALEKIRKHVCWKSAANSAGRHGPYLMHP